MFVSFFGSENQKEKGTPAEMRTFKNIIFLDTLHIKIAKMTWSYIFRIANINTNNNLVVLDLHIEQKFQETVCDMVYQDFLKQTL